MKHKSNQKGVTLIELLVVVAIITILLALALPNYTNARDKARQVTHERNVKELYQAAVMFQLENPDVKTIWSPFPNQTPNPETIITSTNLHESWSLYLSKWPVCPIGGQYVVDIGDTIVITPNGGE